MKLSISRSSFIAVSTFGSIGVAASMSVVWFCTASGADRFEPAVQALGLLAGITGVLAERRSAARERRDLTILAVLDELRRVQDILADSQFAAGTKPPRRRVYLRLPVSATDAALTSGALARQSDNELLRLLHKWRDEVNGFNRRLELTELLVFTSGDPAEAGEFERALRRGGGYLSRVQRHVRDLQHYLTTSSQVGVRLPGPAPAPPAK